MKPVFKCDYCNKMGIEEEIREHEPQCIDNYDRKSCYTCVHKQLSSSDGKYSYKCKAGNEITEGKIFEFCPSYEKKERPDAIENLFDSLFGFGL